MKLCFVLTGWWNQGLVKDLTESVRIISPIKSHFCKKGLFRSKVQVKNQRFWSDSQLRLTFDQLSASGPHGSSVMVLSGAATIICRLQQAVISGDFPTWRLHTGTFKDCSPSSLSFLTLGDFLTSAVEQFHVCRAQRGNLTVIFILFFYTVR